MAKITLTILKLVNIFVVLLYLSVCLVPLLSSGKYWMVAVLGLVFPLLFLIVSAFLIVWIVAGSRWFLISLCALALSWQQLSAMAAFNKKEEFILSKKSENLRILTWNLSSWGESSKNYNKKTDYLPLMLGVIKKEQADVVCLQEFWNAKSWYPAYSNIRELELMGYRYSYYVKTVIESTVQEMGVVILSKYPITDSAKFDYGSGEFAEHLIYADILFQQQKVRVFTTHLQSVRFNNNEYSAISKIKSSDESGLKDSKTIVRKLKHGYLYRETQADLVAEKIKESPYPVIICGDFNDVPNSYTYFTIKGNLQDAFLKKGSGIGRTFQYIFPTLRIDYILADKKLAVKQFNRVTVPYSDHYPIVADLQPTIE